MAMTLPASTSLPRATFRRHLRSSFVFFGLLLLASFLSVAWQWVSVSRWGNWTTPGIEFLVLPLLPVTLLVPVALVGLFLSRFRGRSASFLIGAVPYLALSLFALHLGDQIRSEGFARLALEARPLVQAIHQYQARNGAPPRVLEALIPKDIPEIPSSLPRFQYLAGDDASRYHGNPWVLVFDTSTGLINFDEFAYFPLQNYPETDSSGWWERIDDWGYLHE